MPINSTKKHNGNGFVFIYALLIMVVLSILTLILYNTALQENTTSKYEVESLKAFYAADGGVECAKFYQSTQNTFTTAPPQTFTCMGTTYTATSPIDANCISNPTTQTFSAINFSNGSCTTITVGTYLLTTISSGPNAGKNVCGVNIISSGKNSCANPTVERVRWETR